MRSRGPLLALVLCLLAGAVHADDAPAPEPVAAAQVEGRRLFAEATADLAAGRTDLAQVRDLFIDLEDVHTEQDGSQHDGYLRIYFQAPGRFRLEQRRQKADPPTIKRLDGNRAWISTVDADGKRNVVAKHGRPGGATVIAQLEKDRDRFANLARFLSLGGLAGPGVTFTYQGRFTRPSEHHLAGTWLKVLRVAPKGERMAFLFTEKKGEDGVPHASWPAAALLPGDAARGVPTEHYVFRNWKREGRTARPSSIKRFTQDPESGQFEETFRAFPVALRLNEGLDARWFRPPAGDEAALPGR